MYKKKSELVKMTLMEIAEYMCELERTDEIAKVNGMEYVEWCQSDLMDALDDMGITDEELAAEIKGFKFSQT